MSEVSNPESPQLVEIEFVALTKKTFERLLSIVMERPIKEAGDVWLQSMQEVQTITSDIVAKLAEAEEIVSGI